MKTPTVHSEPGSMPTPPVADNGGTRHVTAQGGGFSPAELAFLICVPLLGAFCSSSTPAGKARRSPTWSCRTR
jgi:hypothetical protein